MKDFEKEANQLLRDFEKNEENCAGGYPHILATQIFDKALQSAYRQGLLRGAFIVDVHRDETTGIHHKQSCELCNISQTIKKEAGE